MVKNISIIIPAKNEADNLPKIVPSIMKGYQKYILEMIIVDDCSDDETHDTVIKLKSSYPAVKLVSRNSSPGVGLAIREGIKYISKYSDYVLLMDCDFLANIADIGKFIKKMDNFDGLVGSRFLKKNSLQNYPWPKLIANRSYNFLARLLLGIKHSDLTNNFKFYRYSLLKKIYPLLISRDFAVNAELGYYPPLLGFTIGQVPVRWQERDKNMGLSKFKILKVGPSYAYIFLRLLMMKLRLIPFPDRT